MADPCDLCEPCDIDMFPGATVVRIGSDKWRPQHDDVLEQVCQQVGRFLQTRPDNLPFSKVLEQLEEQDPHLKLVDQTAHILYGPRKLFLDDRGEPHADIRGLVFRP